MPNAVAYDSRECGQYMITQMRPASAECTNRTNNDRLRRIAACTRAIATNPGTPTFCCGPVWRGRVSTSSSGSVIA